MRANYGIFMGFFLLAACADPRSAITTPPVQMSFTSQTAATNVDTYHLTEMRSFVGQFTSRREISGANCTVFGVGYSAEFTTPAVLRLPLYRGKTSDARVSCQAQTEGKTISAAQTLEATNLSAPDREGITISTGTSGTSVNAVFSIRDRSKDRFDYPKRAILILR